jgi:tRNA-binding protein
MTIAEGFFATDIRVGTILEAHPFPEARKPAIKLKIDFGPEIGIKWSSAQITTYYAPETLVGRQIVAATNLGTKRIAGLTSEVLVLGAMESPTTVVLLAVDRPVQNGLRIA